MFKGSFVINNFYKIYKNFLKKKYILRINIVKFLIRLKKKIFLKIFFIEKEIKKLKIIKLYILKIKKIYKLYIVKIKKFLKLFFLKMPNIINYIVCNKSVIIKKKTYDYGKKVDSNNNYNFNIKLSNNISGRGFYYINSPISLLYKFLGCYLFKIHIKENNYKYLIVPQIISFKSLILSTQIPKFIKKLFIVKIKNKIKYLIPTSEVSIISYFTGKNLNSRFLPVKIISETTCFRNENMFYGLKNKSIIKRKQFDKIELINFVCVKNSYKYLIEMLKNVEKILRRLKISYRIIKLSKYDSVYAATLTYDIEVWIPSLNNYCEVSSCSSTGNYQSLRLNIKYKKLNGFRSYVRIINGSGTAIGRLFLAFLQKHHNSKIIKLPEFLNI